MTTHKGFYDWGSTRQTTDEQIERAKQDLKHAAEALEYIESASPAYNILLVRYERARCRLQELENV